MRSQHHCQGTLLPVSTHHETRVCRALPRDTRPEGLDEKEQREWDAMMEDPTVQDLLYGMGSSEQSGPERPANAPGMSIVLHSDPTVCVCVCVCV